MRGVPWAGGAGVEHLTTRWEKTWRKRNNRPEYRWQELREDLFAQELHTAPDEL